MLAKALVQPLTMLVDLDTMSVHNAMFLQSTDIYVHNVSKNSSKNKPHDLLSPGILLLRRTLFSVFNKLDLSGDMLLIMPTHSSTIIRLKSGKYFNLGMTHNEGQRVIQKAFLSADLTCLSCEFTGVAFLRPWPEPPKM